MVALHAIFKAIPAESLPGEKTDQNQKRLRAKTYNALIRPDLLQIDKTFAPFPELTRRNLNVFKQFPSGPEM